MPFQKGHKLAKGGRRNPSGGRPTKEQAAVKKLAKEIAWEWVEKNARQLMETYGAFAIGTVVERKTSKGKKEFHLLVDSGITKDAVGKLIPAAKQQIELSGGIKIVELDVYDPEKDE